MCCKQAVLNVLFKI